MHARQKCSDVGSSGDMWQGRSSPLCNCEALGEEFAKFFFYSIGVKKLLGNTPTRILGHVMNVVLCVVAVVGIKLYW